MSKRKSDVILLENIQHGGKRAEDNLKHIYQTNRDLVVNYLQKMGADKEEAKDVFQEAMIAMYENVSAGKYRGESTISGYLMAIARFILINRFRRKKKETSIIASESPVQLEESHLPKLISKEEEEKVLEILGLLGEGCRKVLVMSVYYEYSMEEIAKELSFARAQIARNKKYRCLERLRALIGEKPALLDWIEKAYKKKH